MYGKFSKLEEVFLEKSYFADREQNVACGQKCT